MSNARRVCLNTESNGAKTENVISYFFSTGYFTPFYKMPLKKKNYFHSVNLGTIPYFITGKNWDNSLYICILCSLIVCIANSSVAHEHSQ